MKKLLLLLVPVLMLACSKDYTEDINTINGRLDKLEQESIPSVNEQLKLLETAIATLKDVDKDLEQLIDDLEKTSGTHTTEINSLKEQGKALDTRVKDLESAKKSLEDDVKSLESKAAETLSQLKTTNDSLNALSTTVSTIGTNLGNLDKKIDEAVASLDNKIKSAVEQLNSKIAELESRLKAVEGKVSELLARIQSVSYIPEYTDGKVLVERMGQTSSGSFSFRISPKDCISALASVWESALSCEAVYTKTRAVSLSKLAVTEFEGDEENGIITVKFSGEGLSEEFFAGEQEASVALVISDGNNSVTSDYIPIVAKGVGSAVVPESDEITYKTNINQPFVVSAIWGKQSDNAMFFTPYFDTALFIYDSEKDLWRSNLAKYWPTSGIMHFVGFSPYVATTNIINTYNDDGSFKLIQLDSIDNNIMNQHDILFSDLLSEVAPQTSAQPLLFHHAYAQLNVTFKKTDSAAAVVLKSVSVEDVTMTGILTVTPVEGAKSEAVWQAGLPISRYFLDDDATGVEDGALDAILTATTTYAPKPLLVIPGAQTRFEIVYTIDGVEHTYTHTLTDEWKMGYKYTYNYTINVNEIIFDCTVDEWISVDGGNITI